MRAKKILARWGFVLTLVIFMPHLFATPVFAQTPTNPTEYAVLAPLPGTTSGTCNASDPDDPNCKTTLERYLPGVFKLAIGISAVFAVLMIVIGGFQYMTTDAIQGKSAGKERIKNAVYGLVLVIGAWLILNTINPNLLRINLNIESVTVSAPADSGTLGPTTSSRSVTDRVRETCPNCSLTRDNINYSMSQNYINGLSCTTCAPLSQRIPLGGNTNTNVLPDTNYKLSQTQQNLPSNVAWYVSEAYPPVVQHANGCHQRGSCVDVSFGTTPATAQNVNSFISTANSSGLRAIYEVRTASERQTLINSGVAASSVIIVPTINRNHFSVYNCGADSQSCANLP